MRLKSIILVKLWKRSLRFAIFTLAVCLSVLPVYATTRNAASPSYADVSNAVASAANGDTVIIPAGSATWNTQFSTSKAITLQGAGTTSGANLTKITLSQSNAFNVTGVNQPFRLTGIYFECVDRSFAHQFCLNFMGPTTQLRIDHCKFVHGNRTLTFGYANSASGHCWGVIDHCEFIDTDVSIAAGDYRSGDASRGNAGWTEPVRPGTAECMVVEDCTFTQTGANIDEDVYCDRGSKVTVRHCTFNHVGASNGAVDAHGAIPSSGVRGHILYEFYENTFNLPSSYRMCHLRGGSHLFFNNTFTGTGNPIELDGDWGDYITDCYFWNNTRNGSALTGVGIGTGEPGGGGPHLGSYYMHAPQSGQRFYPYTPLVYPHPLVSGTPQDPTPTPTPTPIPTPTPTPLGLSFNSTAGDITAPFIANADNSISQSVETDDPAQGGRAAYSFTVTDAGDYTLLANVNCPDGGSNSFFVDLDGDPISTMVWQVPVTSGFETRTVTWSGITTPRFWTLTANIHQLVFRGREAGAKIKTITLVVRPLPPAAPQVVPGIIN